MGARLGRGGDSVGLEGAGLPVSGVMLSLPGLKERGKNGLLCVAEGGGGCVPRPDGEKEVEGGNDCRKERGP